MANTRGLGKNRAYLMNKLRDMYGDDWNPLIKMCEACVEIEQIAKNNPSMENYEKVIANFGKVAEFITPKLRSQEIQLEKNELVVSINRKDFSGVSTSTDSTDTE